MNNEYKTENSKKWWITIIVVALVLGVIIVMNVISVKARLDKEKLIVSGPLYNQSVLYSQIDTVELREDVDFGSRVFGADYIGVKSGKYYNTEFKNYSLSVSNSTKIVVVIKKKDGNYLLFNVRGNEATQLIYNQLLDKINELQ